MKKQLKKAFTLVELMIVIAIIGVLAAMIFPAVSGAFTVVNKMTASNNAGNIAKAWFSYAKAGIPPHTMNRKDIYSWAYVLATKQDLNNPKIWALEFDPKVMEIRDSGLPMPMSVAIKTGNNWKLNPEFKKFPLSWEVANKVNPMKAGANAPLVWTRGLKPNGNWDKDMGVFGDKGGHIAFVDGRVEWFESLKDEETGKGLLEVFGKEGHRTSNIAQAIEGGSRNILKSKIDVSAAVDDEAAE